jgi:hypothetical protein
VKPVPAEVVMIFIIEALIILALWWLKREVEEKATMSIPKWTNDYIIAWQERLLLGEWKITARLAPEPGGDRDNLASVEVHVDTVIAAIEIRDDCPADLSKVDPETAEYWERGIIHELIHIRLGRIDAIMQELGLELSGGARQLFTSCLRREIEPATELLARAFHGVAKEEKCDANRNERQAGEEVH